MLTLKDKSIYIYMYLLIVHIYSISYFFICPFLMIHHFIVLRYYLITWNLKFIFRCDHYWKNYGIARGRETPIFLLVVLYRSMWHSYEYDADVIFCDTRVPIEVQWQSRSMKYISHIIYWMNNVALSYVLIFDSRTYTYTND